jgi:hypothetical protein
MARRRRDPQAPQRNAVSATPHHRQLGAAPSGCRSVAGSPSGPAQRRHRAGVRHCWQASAGTYPARGTCTRTGRPPASAARAASKATDGIRAARAAGSRASWKSVSPNATIRGDATRSSAGSATISGAHPESTSSCASAVRAMPATTSDAPDACARWISTSRTCG